MKTFSTKAFKNPDQDMRELLVASASGDEAVAQAARNDIAYAIELPLRQGVLDGDIIGGAGIFEPLYLTGNASPEYPLDFLRPGTEKDFIAYSIPNHGYIPQRHIEGDRIMVPTYEIGNAIDWNLKYARDARWDVVSRATQVFMNGFVQKWNADAWHTLITAAADRNVIVTDSDAAPGQFTKRLVSLMKLVMRRSGGGNTGSSGRGRLTDLYVSPEAMEDIRNWNVDQIDEVTRREIFLREDGGMSRIFGVNLHELDELGVGQEFQLFYEDELSGVLPGGDEEIVIGLDLSNRDAFVMPVKEPVSVFDDPTLHRMRRQGIYGWAEQGFAILDNRRVVLGSF